MSSFLAFVAFPLFISFRSVDTDDGSAGLGDEFSGLSLDYDRRRQTLNQYPLEHLALTAIAAMKEESLKDYYAPVFSYTFSDLHHPENSIRIVMNIVRGAALAKLRRCTVMWAINRLATSLMREELLVYLPFEVKYRGALVYQGAIQSGSNSVALHLNLNDSSVSDLASTSPMSLVSVPSSLARTVLHNDTSVNDFPTYDLDFEYTGHLLPMFRVFESILSLLLELGKSSGARVFENISLRMARFQVFIYMTDTVPPVAGHPFQHFQAVAVLEAIARNLVSRDQYVEMTYVLKADGHPFSRGCLTRPIPIRAWCNGLFPSIIEAPSSGENSSVTVE